jgi:hypothetical protein
MPLFFFNVLDGVSIPDDTGTELSDLYAARLEAVRYSGELSSSTPTHFGFKASGASKSQTRPGGSCSPFISRRSKLQLFTTGNPPLRALDHATYGRRFLGDDRRAGLVDTARQHPLPQRRCRSGPQDLSAGLSGDPIPR